MEKNPRVETEGRRERRAQGMKEKRMGGGREKKAR